MAWCNYSLRAGKGKIMDCKKCMFIELSLVVWASAGLNHLSAGREGAWVG